MNKFELYITYGAIICAIISFIRTVTLYYERSSHKHPFYRKNKWIIQPAIIMDSMYSSIFGITNGTFKSLFSLRSIIMSTLISLVANLLFLFILYYLKPKEIIFDTISIHFILMSYITFIIFNAIGDIISIAFTRSVLYQIVHKKGNVNKYIIKELFGIILGYFITLLPLIIILILYLFQIINENETTQYIKNGFIGILFVPFIYLIFITSSQFFLYKLLAFLALFSIAIPTIIFLSTIIIVYFLKKKNKQSYTVDTSNSKIKFLCEKTSAFLAFLSMFLIILKNNQ